MMDIWEVRRFLQPSGYCRERCKTELGSTRQLLEDYRRVRLAEYASAAVFGLAAVVSSYWTFEGLQNDQNTFSTLLSCYLAIGSGSLAKSSFEQGRVMSRKGNELEQKLNQL